MDLLAAPGAFMRGPSSRGICRRIEMPDGVCAAALDALYDDICAKSAPLPFFRDGERRPDVGADDNVLLVEQQDAGFNLDVAQRFLDRTRP